MYIRILGGVALACLSSALVTAQLTTPTGNLPACRHDSFYDGVFSVFFVAWMFASIVLALTALFPDGESTAPAKEDQA